jgi:predicted DCC family thiol-disulfide oxidoreductase YuxK
MVSLAVPSPYSNDKRRVAEKAIILFDGVCNLCNGSVKFIISRDKNNHFLFCSFQSEPAGTMLRQHNYSATGLSTVVLIEGNALYTKSTAALRIARKLGGLWGLLYAFIIVPSFIRDPLYQLVAVNRYSIFGRRETCMIPRPEWKDRFIL